MAAVIISMKGYPCTGKSNLALSLAKVLKCSVICHESIFNCMTMFRQSLPTTLTTIGEEAENLNDVSFQSVCQMALTQLHLKRTVIVDTSLSQRSHLDRLLEVSKSAGARLIIIECIAQYIYEWKSRIERRQLDGAAADGIIGWYKPTTWDDLQRLLERYDWCADDDYDHGVVSKLVVDTTGCLRMGEVSIVNRHGSHDASKHTHFSDVVHWICEERLRPLQISSQLMGRNQKFCLGEPSSSGSGEQEEHGNCGSSSEPLYRIVERIGNPAAHVHRLTLSSYEEENDCKIACRKCLQLISFDTSGAAAYYYTCTHCDLSLHKSCAELPYRKELMPHQLSPIVNPNSGKYSFPEKHSCPFHSIDDDDVAVNTGFMDDCEDCLYHTSLRCGLFPMVLRHRLHESSPLFFDISPIASDTEFMCTACGETRKYMAFYSCRHCKTQFDVGCALLPFSFKNEIHRHPLRLVFFYEDDGSGEYYCDVCEKRRNPKHMMYYCPDCEFPCHLSCMNFLESIHLPAEK